MLSSTISLLLSVLLLWFKGYGWISDLIVNKFSLYSNDIFLNNLIHTGLFFSFYSCCQILYLYLLVATTPLLLKKNAGLIKLLENFCFRQGKKYLLTSILGGGILAGAMFIIDLLVSGFWLWLWMGLAVLMLLINMFYADLIVPIFNKLKPLEDGTLRNKIEAYTSKIGTH